jgi:DNA-binding HxlR family transcriptional regulator
VLLQHFIYTILLLATPYSLEVVLPLTVIYKEKMFRAIVESLLEKVNLKYSELYAAVTDKTRNKVSHRDFSAYLKKMVSENILRKDDSTVRGKRVEYSLTRKALRQSALKILGIDPKVERRKQLYRLLLFYESYKRRPLVSEKQLHIFLKKIGSVAVNLEQLGKWRTHDKTVITGFKDVKGIGIIRLDESKTKPGLYYIVTPGFSVEEFIKYLRMLKRGKDPRPFSSMSSFVPFPVRSVDYTKEEVVDAIESFLQEDLIKPTAPIFPGETRYQISNDSFLGFIRSVWLVRMIDYDLLIARLTYGELMPEDEKHLSLFVNKKVADKFLAIAYNTRHQQNEENDKKEIEKKKEFMKQLNDDRKLLLQEITQIYDQLIKENEVAAQIWQEMIRKI